MTYYDLQYQIEPKHFSLSRIFISFILQHLKPIASVTVKDWEDGFMIDVCVNVCLIGNVL